MKTLKKIYKLFDSDQKKKLPLLFLLILSAALFETIGVAALMPFIAVLAKEDALKTNSWLLLICNFLNFKNHKDFTLFLAFIFLLSLTLSIILKTFLNYFKTNFTLMCEYSIGKQLFNGYIKKPYIWFLDRNSSDISKTILSEASLVTGHAIIPAINLVTQTFISGFLVILLFFVSWKVAISACLLLLLTYGFTTWVVKEYARKIGNARFAANKERFLIVNESFKAIKTVKVFGLESRQVKKFLKPANTFSKNLAHSAFIVQFPHNLAELIVFSGIVIVLMVCVSTYGSLGSAIPTISVFALAVYRLMPAIQQLYGSYMQIKTIKPSLEQLNKEILQSLKDREKAQKLARKNIKAKIYFEKFLNLNKITYSYPNSKSLVLKEVDLRVLKGKLIGIMGPSGGGKTTLIDIILGILEPTSGKICVDGKTISSQNVDTWRSKIGYAPQSTFIADSSVAENVGYGENKSTVNLKEVVQACKFACIHDFITKKLPNGYDTKIGEDGVKLSGGQRQRIGIARALYRNPEILILDEATSALDMANENKIIKEIKKMTLKKTIIMISHREASLRRCDQIFLLKNGKIEEIKNANSFYRSLNVKKIFNSPIKKTDTTHLLSG